MNANFRNLALWAIIGLLVVALVMLFQQPSQRTPIRDISYSELLSQVDQGRVHDVIISGNEITGHFNDNRPFFT
ncbi:MAG: ATP-dependent metallopeptidase FtsH/Yme1/Tma family protein, partial [Planctomycetaceae bacterium]